MAKTVMPLLFCEAMSSLGEDMINAWWAGLDEGARADVVEFWYNSTNGQPAIATVVGRVNPVNETAEREFWHNDFYEYLINHELYFVEPRPFHVCTEHHIARQAVRSGYINGDFQCPLGRETCPMRTILHYTCGQSISLSLAFEPLHRGTR
ncbi:hypothetical protein ACXR0O_09605 [Verrucomicrobiota bacterium sgz303538]